MQLRLKEVWRVEREAQQSNELLQELLPVRSWTHFAAMKSVLLDCTDWSRVLDCLATHHQTPEAG